jgi:hypothetical protein
VRVAWFLLLIASLFPQVEDPWPKTIGLEFMIATTGAGGVVTSVLYAGAPEARRDRAVRRGGLIGFGLGALFYVLALLNQLISG